MKPRSSQQKGKDLENHVAHQIERYGLARARRSAGSGSGNREKADIDTALTILGVNAGIECKNHKTAAVQEWWKQACNLEVLGREPIVVYKLYQEPYEDTKAIIRLDTLLRLLKRAKEPTTKDDDNRELQWTLRTLIQAAKKLLKILEN